LPFTALLANADAATFNLLRRGWFIPSDNIEGHYGGLPRTPPRHLEHHHVFWVRPSGLTGKDQVASAAAG
jgi:hypothetical protein